MICSILINKLLNEMKPDENEGTSRWIRVSGNKLL